MPVLLGSPRDQMIAGIIGDQIELTVVDIRGDKVRIGIKAPPSVTVHRKEVHDAIKRENEAAAAIAGTGFGGFRPQVPLRSAAARLPAARVATRCSERESA